MIGTVSRFRSLVGKLGGRTPPSDEVLRDLDRTRAKLAAVRAKAHAQGSHLRQRVDRLEGIIRDLKADAVARMPNPDILEESVALRYGALLESSSRRKIAQSLEARLSDRSDAYREAREMGAGRIDECEGPIHILGLQWWFPRQLARDPRGLTARLRSGQLPFKSILASRELAQGTVMLDIGANIGTTCIPRVVLGDFQRVYAAEPEPRNYNCLVQNVLANELDGFVLPDRVALGATDGELSMRLAEQIGAHRINTRGRESRSNRLSVPSRRLDTWVNSLDIDAAAVSFIKCDVQGWELQVMAGAPLVLGQRHIVWQFEVSPKHLEKSGTTLAEFCDAVSAHFDCFIDLSGQGPRGRATTELKAALSDLGEKRRFTDILAYNKMPANRCG